MRANQTQFTVIYDGEALRDSRMDVRELAPALLALGTVLEQANRVLNGDKATVSIQVRAFESGCFGISLELVQSCAQTVMGWLTPGNAVRESLEIIGLLGFSPLAAGYGLYKLIRFAKGKKPKNAQTLQDGNVCLTFEFNVEVKEKIIVSREVANLYSDLDLREAVQKSLAPLEREGIDSFSVEYEGKREELATSEDIPYFITPSAELQEISVDETPRETVLSIVSLSFKEDNKWRLSDGSANFHVRISDKDFLRSIDEGVSFAKGDLLRVLLVTKVSYAGDGLKTDYEAIKILEHSQRPRQLNLPET